MDYTKYTVDDFIADESFQRYCLKLDEKDIDFWIQWKAEHPEMRSKLEEARHFIASLEVLNKHKQDVTYYHRKQAIRDSLRNSITAAPASKSFSINPWYLAAASVLIFIFAFGTFYFTRRSASLSPEIAAVNYTEVSTLPGKRDRFQLPDGSVVHLNSNSKLRYPETFDALNTREVVLEGEAFFEVIKDAAKPFTVHSRNIQTTALGTSFTVRAYSDQSVSVALTTGKVSVINKTDSLHTDPVLLSPGQGAMLAEGSERLSTFQFDSKEYLAWKDGILYFSNASEQEVMAKLESWYGIEIKRENKTGKTWEYTGEFHQKRLPEVLTAISFTMDFDYQVSGNTVIIRYKTK